MKKTIVSLILLVCIFSVAGCGEKDTKNNLEGDIKDNTKVSNIAESHSKYIDLKSTAYDKLSDKLIENESPLSFSFLGFVSADLIIAPISICGLGENEASFSYKLFNITDYVSEKDKCNITFKSDGQTSKFETLYDAKTDSIKSTMYEGNDIKVIYEYIKLNEGYATIQYYYDDENITSYRSIFNETYISIGFFEDVQETPVSIYKGSTNIDKSWTKGGIYWVEYENGKYDAIIN